MSTFFQKFISLLLTVLTVIVTVLPVNAETPDDFDETDRPVMENTTDSSRLPGYRADLSDVYGQTDTTDADVINSMISDEAIAAFEKKLDETLGFQPAEQAEVTALLSEKDSFVRNGGIQAYIADPDLVASSEIGLTENRDDKVRVLGMDANASAWIYIVEKDAVCFIIQDDKGNGIPHALVTVSWLDESGKRVTRSTLTTDGNAAGIASFANMPESFHGIVDVQAEGMRSATVLDKNMAAGEHYFHVLHEAEENDLYIRGADLSGKDLINEETSITLMKNDTEEDLTMQILVTKRGNEKLPSSIELYSENRGKTILTFTETSDYEINGDTRVYSAVRRWAEQSAHLFDEDDLVSVKFGDRSFTLEHMSFTNAVVKAGLQASTMPLTSKPMEGNVTDRLGGTGAFNVTAEILHVPVTIGQFPNGDAIILASYDITNLDPNTQYKYSSLFQKSWNPKTMANAEECLEIFEKSFWENAEKVKDGKKKLESADKIACLRNTNYNVSMSFALYLVCHYNKETSDCYGTGGIMFSAGVSGGITEYFLFIAGPVVIPAYIGFEVGFMINTSLNLDFGVNQPPAEEADDIKWAYAAGGEEDVTSRIEAIVSFALFGGIGVKGVLGLSGTGYINLDIATILGKGEGNIFTAREHSLIDLLYGLKFHYYLLFFTGEIKLECLNGAKRIWDSNGESDLSAEEEEQLVFKELSLKACADELVPVLAEGEEGVTDRAYTIAGNSALSGSPDIVNVDALTYPDSQIQIASAKNCTALFRIVSDGTKTKLVYQMIDLSTGDPEPAVYEVELPDERSVTEYVVAANKTDADQPAYCDNVYIGAILADSTAEGLAERAHTTDVAAIVVNLAERKTLSSRIVSDQRPVYKNNYYYSAPLPAGAEDYCAVAYCASHISDLENETDLLEALSTNTQNMLAAYSTENPGRYETVGLGYGKVYSTGVIAPYEPSFWMVDQIYSTDKTLVLKGFAANGYYSDADGRCRVAVDIRDRPASDFDYSNIISNWQFMNGRNYFFVYDSVWWMDKSFSSSDHTQYTWKAQKVTGSEKLSGTDYRYTMITDSGKSAVYVVAVVGDYEVNMAEGTAVKTSNRAQIYPIITAEPRGDGGTASCTVHGPLAINFAYGDPVINFAAFFNPESSASGGISIVYSTPAEIAESGNGAAGTQAVSLNDAQEEEQAAEAVSLRMWKQNADSGMRATKVAIPDYAVEEGQKYLNVYVTVRNYGYTIEDRVMFRAWDEEGHNLPLSNGKQDLDDGQTLLLSRPIYTGDSDTVYIMIRPYAGWKVDEEHEIFVEVLDRYYYPGNLDDVVNTAKVQADNTSMSAENILVGGKHYVSISIRNNTFTGEKTPVIKAVLDYGDREETKLFSLPTREKVFRFDEEGNGEDEEIWHYDIDMDRIWKDGLKEGLFSAVFTLVDQDGVQQSNEIIRLPNPAEEIKDRAEGMKTDEDGNPLSGAVFTLYNEAEEVMTAVSEEDGTVRFGSVGNGSYVIRETEAPEGYVKDDTEFTFNAEGNGETFSFTAVNRKIQGSLRITLKDDKGSPVTGAKFAVYSGETLIGYLKDEGKGVYTMDGLVYGDYTVKCEKVPAGFESVSPLSFSVKEDGKTVELTAKAVRKGSADPSANTSDSSHASTYMTIFLLSLAAAVLVFVQRRRMRE